MHNIRQIRTSIFITRPKRQVIRMWPHSEIFTEPGPSKILMLKPYYYFLPPGYPCKKAARLFLADGFLRNVIALITFFVDIGSEKP